MQFAGKGTFKPLQVEDVGDVTIRKVIYRRLDGSLCVASPIGIAPNAHRKGHIPRRVFLGARTGVEVCSLLERSLMSGSTIGVASFEM